MLELESQINPFSLPILHNFDVQNIVLVLDGFLLMDCSQVSKMCFNFRGHSDIVIGYLPKSVSELKNIFISVESTFDPKDY